ncbi:DUF3592 domain-containing protein [Cellulomonas dongxiuzhuiae]|uniref:DUF3592 domain-containing protein n=1 Tax=Cellulomonas dongxiuzhuiae TaxID=2819979 RepID=UPI001FBA9BD4|nr:DUF3592 domain-containing protein [Cellulomonas dongxiuzhuiae]
MTVATVVPLTFACVLFLAGVGLGLGGGALLRRGARTPRTRIPLEAVVVERTSHVRPTRVTFDHPVPGGWVRATRVEGMPVTTADGRTARPGDRITVWADARDPRDVRLAAASAASSMGGVLLLLMGAMLAGLALWFAMAVLAAR